MIRRFVAVSLFSSAALLGYVGVRRLGAWIDAPSVAVPGQREVPATRVLRPTPDPLPQTDKALA